MKTKNEPVEVTYDNRKKAMIEMVRVITRKKIIGEPLYRICCGKIRITYKIDPQTITIIRVGKSNDGESYKRLSRL